MHAENKTRYQLLGQLYQYLHFPLHKFLLLKSQRFICLLMKIFLCLFIALGVLWAGPEDREIWVIEQEFIKFGRKEAFETAKKKWIADFKKSNAGRTPDIIGLEDGSDNEYLFLMPFKNFAEIDSFRKQLRNYNGMVETQVLKGLINFKVLTIHQYKASCSYTPSSVSIMNSPQFSYEIVSLEPGSEEAFEQMLIQKASDAVKKKSKQSWRVWKTVAGAELPKYIVAWIKKSKEKARESLIDPNMNEFIRRKQEGKAVVKPELCLGIEVF